MEPVVIYARMATLVFLACVKRNVFLLLIKGVFLFVLLLTERFVVNCLEIVFVLLLLLREEDVLINVLFLGVLPSPRPCVCRDWFLQSKDDEESTQGPQEGTPCHFYCLGPG